MNRFLFSILAIAMLLIFIKLAFSDEHTNLIGMKYRDKKDLPA